MTIPLPISKSIANRLLLLHASKGGDLSLLHIDNSTPDDVQLMYRSLVAAQEAGDTPFKLDLQNCGTAMRMLTAYFAQKQGREVVLDGTERMHHRPIGQLVDALRAMGADIQYLGSEGFPPLLIRGKELDKKQVVLNNPLSTQFVSALLLIGAQVQTTCQSPYITMTQSLLKHTPSLTEPIESDWSAAAFWYEYAALNKSTLFLHGLKHDSLQADKAAVELFRQFGVNTTFENDGVKIIGTGNISNAIAHVDFSSYPDLYPTVFATCFKLGIQMRFSGLESLTIKESNRIDAMNQLLNANHNMTLSSFDDHRIAMALLCAGYNVDNTDCINKSYPTFISQWKRLQS